MTRGDAKALEARRFPSRPIAAVGAIILRDGLVLLVKRGQPPALGEWSIPGGVVEAGETLAGALVREVVEETGLSVTVGPVVDVVDRIFRDAEGRVEFHYVIADFLCREVADTPSRISVDPRAQSDVEDVRWVELASLTSYRVTEQLRRAVEKALALAGLDATR